MKDALLQVYSENDKVNDFNENCADFKYLTVMAGRMIECKFYSENDENNDLARITNISLFF